MIVRRPLGRLLTFSVAALATACAQPAAQTLCETTIAMAAEVTEDGEPSQASIDAFVAAAPGVQDPELREAATEAAAALTHDPASGLDRLAAVFDRCAELDRAGDT